MSKYDQCHWQWEEVQQFADKWVKFYYRYPKDNELGHQVKKKSP
jgi:hypothetical protein